MFIGTDLYYSQEFVDDRISELKEAYKEIERLNNIIEDFEEELEREVNIKEEDTGLEHNTYIDINATLKTVLKRFRKLKGENNEWWNKRKNCLYYIICSLCNCYNFTLYNSRNFI